MTVKSSDYLQRFNWDSLNAQTPNLKELVPPAIKPPLEGVSLDDLSNTPPNTTLQSCQAGPGFYTTLTGIHVSRCWYRPN